MELRGSDWSGELIRSADEGAQALVDSEEFGMKRLDMTLEEAQRIEELAVTGLTAVVVKLPDKDGEAQESKRYLLTQEALSELATRASVEAVLSEARSAVDTTPRGRRGSDEANGERRDHDTLDWAGSPHKGRTSPVEAQLVRQNLVEVNAKLRERGMREVDPLNPEHARRYGFGAYTPGSESAGESEEGDSQDEGQIGEGQGDEPGGEPPAETGETAGTGRRRKS